MSKKQTEQVIANFLNVLNKKSIMIRDMQDSTDLFTTKNLDQLKTLVSEINNLTATLSGILADYSKDEPSMSFSDRGLQLG